jgi:hypothetical protein
MLILIADHSRPRRELLAERLAGMGHRVDQTTRLSNLPSWQAYDVLALASSSWEWIETLPQEGGMLLPRIIFFSAHDKKFVCDHAGKAGATPVWCDHPAEFYSTLIAAITQQK